jgi:hypothetical protein
MVELSQIREHMEVVAADGGHIGRVDHVRGADIELAKFDFGAGLRHHLIPLSWIDDVTGDQVRLNKTADAAKAEWKVKH